MEFLSGFGDMLEGSLYMMGYCTVGGIVVGMALMSFLLWLWPHIHLHIH